MTTIVDLQLKADSSQIDKAADSLKKAGEAAKVVGGMQGAVASEIKKTSDAFFQLEKNASKVGSSLHDVAASFNPLKLAAGGLAGIIGGLTLGALQSMVMGVISARAEIYKLSETTGLSVSVLSGLKSVALETGTSMDVIATLTQKFNAAVSTSGRETSIQNTAFKNLGINLKDTNGNFKDSITLQIESAKALNEHKDGIEKDAYYMAIWGKQAIANKDYLKNLGEQTEVHGKLTEEQAKKAHDTEVALAKLGKATNELKGEVTDATLTALLPFISALNDASKAAGGLNNALNPKNIDLLWMSTAKYGQAIADTKKELEDLGKVGHWYNLGMKDDQAFVDAQRQVLEQRLKTLTAFQGKIDAAAEKARDSFRKAEHGGDGSKPVLANIKDKEVPGGHEAPTPSDSGYEQANKREEDTVIKLRAAYQALFGIQGNVHALELQASIDAGDFNAKYNKKKELIKEAASVEQIAALKAKAANADYLEGLNKVTKAENDRWEAAEKSAKAEQEKVTQLRQTNAQQDIAREVLKVYGKTQDDVNVAIANYNVAQAETALVIARASGATEQEVFQLQAKLDALKEIAGLTADQKDGNDAETKRQQTFSAGWSKAFNDYKKNAADASQDAGKVFGSVTSKMGDALSTFVTTGKLDFKGLAASIIADLAKIAAEKAIAGLVGALFADGGAFSNGTQMFADGGVVNSPTAFGMSGGRMGVMGEAGPEAIVPLKRGPDGKLGIGSNGSSAAAQPSNVNIVQNISIGSVDSAERQAAILKAMRDQTVAITKQVVADQMRQGGMLNRKAA